MTIGGQPSHRPSLGKCWSPLINLHATRGIELVSAAEFFAPPMSADELKHLFSSKGDNRSKNIPDSSCNDVFGTNDAKLAAAGFTGTLKMFAAELFLNGRLTFRNTLVSYSHALPQRRSKKDHYEYLFFTKVSPSRLDYLRAGSQHISQTTLRWPSRAATYLEYHSDGVMVYVDEKPAIGDDILESIHVFEEKFHLRVVNVLPDENCLFSALSDQKDQDVDKESGKAAGHLNLRVSISKWISNHLSTDLHGKTIQEWLVGENHTVSVEDYLKKFAQGGTGVGSCVALLAASQVLQKPIFVFRSDHKFPIEFSSLDWIGVNPLCIGLFVAKGAEEGHFFSLRSDKSWNASSKTDSDSDGGSPPKHSPAKVKQEDSMEVDTEDVSPKKRSSKKDKKQK